VGGFGRKPSQPASNGEVVRVAFAQVSRQNRQTVSSDGRRSVHYGCIPEVAGSNPAPATNVKPQVRALFRLGSGALFCVRCGCIAPIPREVASKIADA
jgi:hypothetical protein